jgi:hypothetical protein
MVSIEEQIDWFAQLIRSMEERGATTFDIDPEAERNWVAHVNERACETLYMSTKFLLQRRRGCREAAGVHALFGRRARIPP